MILGVDYSWTHPNPQEIYDAGYRFVVRYLSNDESKNLNENEATALHAAGLAILLYWEAGAQGALGGAPVGATQSATANDMAGALGYPDCPIFYAVDFNAQGLQYVPISAYFNAIGGRPKGLYGSFLSVETIPAAYYVQTEAWSGTQVSPRAHLYQRVQPTLTIPNAQGSYDELVLLQDVPMWGKEGIVNLLAAAPVPVPAPPPPPPPVVTPPTPHPTEVTVNVPVLSEQSPGEHVVSTPVRNLQILLVNHGFSVGASGADGRYGPATAAAVVEAERHFGLSVDSGIAGEQVWTALCNK